MESPKDKGNPTEHHEPVIEVDNNEEASSKYGSDLSINSPNIDSSIMNHVYENGRRYHAYKSGRYLLPNDESEQDRLDLHHHIYLLALDGELTLAPLGKNIQRVLDIGTGTGIWAIDFADTYPSAEVIGTDLSPIQPSWIPPNCRFEIDDAEATWLWSKNYFDFVHLRNLTQSIQDWPRLLAQIYAHSKPGAYIEIIESEDTSHSNNGSVREDFCIHKINLLYKGTKKIGLVQPPGSVLKRYMEEAGFRDIQFRCIKLPIGTWPREPKLKEIGKCHLFLLETIFTAYGMRVLTQGLSMDPDEAAALCDGARRDLLDKKNHFYCNVYELYKVF